ncbi:MAG TPA: plastocyanin/azurin family copper-binding protein [Solirubrobacteraceae bacterium]|nr:plastocyanin/azurin family copper-binding protein [Solirubrobacteraceae bacterium]
MRRSLAWWVVGAGTLVWVLALTQGWLGGEPGREPGGAARKVQAGSFDPRDVPITVDVYEYGFNPSNVVIKAGHAVAWRDVGKEHHTIEPSTRAGRAPFLEASRTGSASHVFRRPGVYAYHCSIHPAMEGTVTVRRRL